MGQLHFSIAGSVPRERSDRDDPARAAKALALLLIVGLFLLPEKQPQDVGPDESGPAAKAAPNDTGPVANDRNVAPPSDVVGQPPPKSQAESATGSDTPPQTPPPPVRVPVTLSISPNRVEFHQQPVGTPRGDYKITFYNQGRGRITLQYADATGDADFQLNGACAGAKLEPAESCEEMATFAPQAGGERTGSRNILVDSAVVGSIDFTGQGTTMSIELPDRVVFEGDATSQSLLVRNTGTAALQIMRTSISTARPFDRDPQSCISHIPPGAECTIVVTIRDGPRAAAQEATFTIEDNSPDSPHQVPLRAEVYAAVLSAVPRSVGFGAVPAGELRDVPIKITNTGNAPMGALHTYVSGAGFRVAVNDCNASSAQDSQCVITVRFSPPAASTNYDGSLMVTSRSGGASVSIALHGSGAAIVGHDPTHN